MTEKRFNLVGSYLFDGDYCISHFDDYKHREVICNKMNELSDKNEILLVQRNFYLKQSDDLEKENKELKSQLNWCITILQDNNIEVPIPKSEETPFLKIIDDYFIKYGDDGELFSMHKPSNIRSLMHILNREHGYNELQCEYNDKELKE